MLIPTAVGINTASQTTGPSTSSWLLPLDLHQVSTIAHALPGATGNITRQLTLADLGTDCPQTADPTAIATMVDSRCDPVLAAPTQVREWAYPCNACGRFGLFDPPYAVPTLTGGLVVPTSTLTSTSEVVVVTAVPPPTSTVVAQTPTSTRASPAVTGTGVPGSAGAGGGGGGGVAGSSAGAASSGTVVSSAADPGVTASVVGSGSVGASGTAAPPVTAAGARAGVVEGVAGMWWIPGVSVVVVLFWL